MSELPDRARIMQLEAKVELLISMYDEIERRLIKLEPQENDRT